MGQQTTDQSEHKNCIRLVLKGGTPGMYVVKIVERLNLTIVGHYIIGPEPIEIICLVNDGNVNDVMQKLFNDSSVETVELATGTDAPNDQFVN